MTCKLIADHQDHCGEGPTWHPDQRAVIWTDIPTGRLMRHDPATGSSTVICHDRPVGGLTVQADGSLLLFRDQGNVAVMRDGRITGHLIDQIDDEVGTRFNDVIADPAGRVFCGTMPVPEGQPGGPRPGRLYRLDPDTSIHCLLEGIGCSNGMDFLLNNHGQAIGLYHIDSPTRRVDLFDYDPATGDIINRRPAIDLADHRQLEGVPDGMTLDTDGNLLVALWGGSGVARFAPDGRYLSLIELPARQVTCPIFAPATGDDGAPFDTLYITSANAQDRPASGQHAGALFAASGIGTGRPAHRSRIGL